SQGVGGSSATGGGAQVATVSGVGGSGGTWWAAGGSGDCVGKEGEYTHYWILGQLPAQTTAYLYARNGAKGRFGGRIASPVPVDIPQDTFQSHNVGSLGYTQTETEWYFLEVTGDCPFMVNFDRVAQVLVAEDTFEDRHGDSIHDKPPTRLGQNLTFAFGE